jgi:hypothetical protein
LGIAAADHRRYGAVCDRQAGDRERDLKGAHALTEKHSIPRPRAAWPGRPALAKRAKNLRKSGEVYAYQRGVASVQLRINERKLIGKSARAPEQEGRPEP